MTTIHKYPIPVHDTFHLNLSRDARCLHVAVQHGEPQLWVLVELDNPDVRYHFTLVGTGHPAPSPDKAEHLGSFQLKNGLLVFHLFVDRETTDV